jgi:hypothetical protein
MDHKKTFGILFPNGSKMGQIPKISNIWKVYIIFISSNFEAVFSLWINWALNYLLHVDKFICLLQLCSDKPKLKEQKSRIS